MKTRNSAVLGLCLLVGGGALTGLAISAPATAADDVPLVGATTSWRYLQNDTFPGGAEPLSWTLPQFDDAAWLSGRGTFGGKISSGVQSPVYDAANTATNQLEMNAPGASTRVRTYFFRADFELSPQQIADIAVVRGKLSFDDGAVVYVNGQEVGRHDVAVGQEGLNYAPGGTTSMDSLNLAFGPDVLVPGTNTIAVESTTIATAVPTSGSASTPSRRSAPTRPASLRPGSS
ncbi:hypothetical protein ACLM5J_05590 [Nocardioides sp. Bht2]|uniref:hypothetical protein n=1 Tax=Nocardioides sp. Bht2 TaxID=3392297 RepID=UPI0039B3AD74